MFQSINNIYYFLFLSFFILIAEYKNLKCHLGARVSGLGFKNTIIPQSVIPCPSDWLCANLHLNIKANNISLPFNLNQYLNQYLFRIEPFILESQHCVPPMNCSDICKIVGLVLPSEVLKCEHHCCSDDLCNENRGKDSEQDSTIFCAS